MERKYVGQETDGTPVFECGVCHMNFLGVDEDGEETDLCEQCRSEARCEDLMLEIGMEKRRLERYG